jgi:hypothetical protein
MRSKMHIPKVFLVLAGIFLLTAQVKAQEGAGLPSLTKFWVGIKGGGSMSALSSDAKLNSDWSYGYQAGATASYAVLDWLRISFEPVYAKFNSKIKPSTLYYPNQDVIDRIVKSDVSLDCVDLPLLFKLGIPGYGRRIKPIITIGATSGIFFKATSSNTWNYNVGNQLITAKVTDIVTERFRYYDIAGIGGAGLEIANISLELYYRFALRDVNTVHSPTYKDYGLNSLQVNFGCRF